MLYLVKITKPTDLHYCVYLVALLLNACSSLPTATTDAKWADVAQHTLTHTWSADIGEPPTDTASFSIQPQLDNKQIFTLDVTGLVQSRQRDTGSLLWEQQLPADTYSGIDVQHELIVVTAQSGTLLALDKEKGSILWRHQLPASILSSAKIAQKQVIAQLDNEQLLSLDSKSAKVLWRYYSGSTPFLTLRGTATPHIDGSVVYTGFANGNFIALDSTNGSLLWQQNLIKEGNKDTKTNISDIDSSFSVEGDYIFAHTHTGKLTAVNKETGRVIWRSSVTSKYPPVTSANSVYVVDLDNYLYALDKITGEIRWMQGALQSSKLSAPLTLLYYVVIGDEHGNLYLISQTDGIFVSSLDLGEAITGNSLVSYKDSLFLIDNDATLHALRLE
jgi:outer membrane protein assembly factor BamB